MRRASSHNYIGERRTICKFLFLPKVIDDESRWLKWVCIEQVWGFYTNSVKGIPSECLGWKDYRWADHTPNPPKFPQPPLAPAT
jgi:hypothetical protein